MDEIWAGQARAPHDGDRATHAAAGALDAPADDPLGDEAAFPSTWQQLADGDAGDRG
jgi:hypothetical protein